MTASFPPGQPAPGYPPGPQRQYAYPYPPARPHRARWISGLLAAILFLIAGGLAVWGSFERIRSFRQEFGGNDVVLEYRVTWWDYEQVSPTGESSYPPYGIVLVTAAALLLAAAVLAVSVFGRYRAGRITATRVCAALGTGVLTGAVALQLLEGLNVVNAVNDRDLEPGDSITVHMGLGIWLPAAAAAAALVGMALTLTRHRGATARVEPETPRLGVPMPYGAQPHQGYPQSGPLPAQQYGQYPPAHTPPTPSAPFPAPQSAAQQAPQPAPQSVLSPPEAEPASESPAADSGKPEGQEDQPRI